MKSILIKVFGILFLLVFVAILGIANHWNGCGPSYASHEAYMDYNTSELTLQLELNQRQTEIINEINNQFYQEVVTECKKRGYPDTALDGLILAKASTRRNNMIFEILNARQKILWKNIHPTILQTNHVSGGDYHNNRY